MLNQIILTLICKSCSGFGLKLVLIIGGSESSTQGRTRGGGKGQCPPPFDLFKSETEE